MNIETILTVLLRYLPDVSLSVAMSMASELSATGSPIVPDYSVPEEALVQWIRAYAIDNGREHVSTHKALTIKALRDAFQTDDGKLLGLRECKNAVDRYCASYGYIAF